MQLINAIARVFAGNRSRLRNLASKPGVAKSLKLGMLITMLLWLSIALLAKKDQDNRLTEAVQGLLHQPDNGAVSPGQSSDATSDLQATDSLD